MKRLLMAALCLSSFGALACNKVELNVQCQAGCSLPQSNDANTLALAVKAAHDADACVDSLITVYKVNQAAAGVVNVYRYFKTTAAPVVSSAHLADLGWERWTEGVMLPPPPPIRSDTVGWWLTGLFWGSPWPVPYFGCVSVSSPGGCW